MICHAGYIVADYAVPGLLLRQVGVILRHAVGMLHEEDEQSVQGHHRLVAFLGNRGM